MRLDILTRVSRTVGREGDSYGSPEIQLKDCRAWIAAQGRLEGEHFHQETVSGGALLAKRPGLQGVIERMRCGRADGVVVRAYDRFMRSVALSWEVIELIEGRDGYAASVGCSRPRATWTSRRRPGGCSSRSCSRWRSISARTRGTSGRSRGPGRGSAVSGSRDHRRAT
jgi:hypothetical protein